MACDDLAHTLALAGRIRVDDGRLGPLSRQAFAIAIPTTTGYYLSTTSCLDCLGLGALLALQTGKMQRCISVPLWLGASLLVSCWAMSWFGVGWKAMTTIRPFSYSVVFAWLIGGASHGFTGRGGGSWPVGRWFIWARSAMVSTSTTLPFRHFWVTGVCRGLTSDPWAGYSWSWC